MKNTLFILLCLGLMCEARGQHQKNELRLSAGILKMAMRDEQASPLRYGADAAAVQLRYVHRGNRSRFGIEFAPAVGTALPDRFGVRRYGDDFYSYAVESAYYQLDLGVHYLRRLTREDQSKLHLFVGGGIRENFRYADAVANFNWATNLLALRAEGRAEWTPGARHRFTAQAGLPVFAAVTRHAHANFPKSTHEPNLVAFFREGTRRATVNHLQQLALEATYQFRVSKRWGVGGTYAFEGFRYSLPRTVRAVNQSFLLESGYHF
ncbi:MAG: hypothetical protein ICV83_35560 [Cytophagales bacterium]|nr:hypothetical protein [Cytophagales bacterium]